MISIVGGGWFGCHIAASLLRRGITDFKLYEAASRLFDGASGHNQNRLHLGFHYPRSASTREQSKNGFAEFTLRYPELSEHIADNFYAVVKGESLIDYETYKVVTGTPAIDYCEIMPSAYGITNVEGAVHCNERLIRTNTARNYFTSLLAHNLELNSTFHECIGDGPIINCTYQAWQPSVHPKPEYESCVTLLYSTKRTWALTLMDGPFYSIYPYEEGMATLYSVQHSRLARFYSYSTARRMLDTLTSMSIERLQQTMETGIRKYYPVFRDEYKFEGWYGAVRAIQKDASDARVCRVVHDGRIIHVMPGKIDSIFHAEREVMRCLGYS